MAKPYFLWIIRLAFQHYQSEYDVPVVDPTAVLLGTLDVSSVRVRLSPKILDMCKVFVSIHWNHNNLYILFISH